MLEEGRLDWYLVNITDYPVQFMPYNSYIYYTLPPASKVLLKDLDKDPNKFDYYRQFVRIGLALHKEPNISYTYNEEVLSEDKNDQDEDLDMSLLKTVPKIL